MLSRYEKYEKMSKVRALLVEIDSDERCFNFGDKAKAEATLIARIQIGNALDLLRQAERQIMIRDGEIQP